MSTARWRCAPVGLWQVLHTVLPEEGPFPFLSRWSAGASASSLCPHQAGRHQTRRLWSDGDSALSRVYSVMSTGEVRHLWHVEMCALPLTGSARLPFVPLENTTFWEFSAPQGCYTSLWSGVVSSAFQLVVCLFRFLHFSRFFFVGTGIASPPGFWPCGHT